MCVTLYVMLLRGKRPHPALQSNILRAGFSSLWAQNRGRITTFAERSEAPGLFRA